MSHAVEKVVRLVEAACKRKVVAFYVAKGWYRSNPCSYAARWEARIEVQPGSKATQGVSCLDTVADCAKYGIKVTRDSYGDLWAECLK